MTKYTTNHTSTKKKMSNKKRETKQASRQTVITGYIRDRNIQYAKKGHVVGKMEGNHLFF